MQLHYGWDDFNDIDWMTIIPILLPFVLIAGLLILFALIDLYRNRHRRENVLMWTLIIIFINTIGPILYFILGRKDRRRT
ncbi:preprotein translocase subunit YajC [Sporosarcina luteola]|nr:preprotein translocase subunit YajC [Sporosarcina luteola]